MTKYNYGNLRLRHVIGKGLVDLAKRGFLESGKLNKLEFCDHFILWKQHKWNLGMICIIIVNRLSMYTQSMGVCQGW